MLNSNINPPTSGHIGEHDMSEFKTVTITDVGQPQQKGKYMRVSALVDGQGPFYVVFPPEKASEYTEGAQINARYSPQNGNFAANWFSNGAARSGGGFKGGGGKSWPRENPLEKRAGVAMSYAVQLVVGGKIEVKSLMGTADKILDWMTAKVGVEVQPQSSPPHPFEPPPAKVEEEDNVPF